MVRALATDRAVEDGCCASAIEELGEGFTAEDAQAQLDLACRDPASAPHRARSLLACISVLKRRGCGEPALLGALALGHDAVRVAAASALGRVGSAAAVLPLKEAAERGGGALPNAARNAVAEIQSRLTGSPGELSLAQGEGGGLSLADDAGGRLSIPDPSSSGNR